MTDPRYPGSGPPYGSGYPPPDPYGQPQQYAPPQQYGQPQQYGAPQQYSPPQQYDPGQQYGQYGNTYGTPTQYGNPYAQPSPFGTPPPKRGGGLKVAGIVIGALVLVAALALGALYVIGSKTRNTSDVAGPAASAGSSHGAAPSSAAPQPKSTDPTDAKIGDCLAGQTMDSNTAKEVTDVKIVSCTATDAKYKVVGIVTGKTESQFNVEDNICSAYPSAVSELWQGRTGEAGSVLCLAPAKK